MVSSMSDFKYPTPDELDALIDKAQMSPDQEAWCVMAVMDYRLVCQQVMLALAAKEKVCVE